MPYEYLSPSQIDELCRDNFHAERNAEADRYYSQADEAEEAGDYTQAARCRAAAEIVLGH